MASAPENFDFRMEFCPSKLLKINLEGDILNCARKTRLNEPCSRKVDKEAARRVLERLREEGPLAPNQSYLFAELAQITLCPQSHLKYKSDVIQAWEENTNEWVRGKIQTLEEQQEAAQKMKAEHESRISELGDQLNAAQGLHKLEESLREASERAHKETKEQAEELREQCRLADAATTRHATQISNYEEQIQALSAEADQLRNHLRTKTTEYQNSEASLRAEMSDLKEQVIQLTRDKQKLTTEIELAKVSLSLAMIFYQAH